MVGVRRASVTEAALALSEAGAIEYRRGFVTVLDRRALERSRVRVLLDHSALV